MTRIDSLPVLIVGAGPSGLMMAYELTRFGISCVIIEKDLLKSPYSRAIGVQIRSLEIFKALGLYDKLVEHSWPIQGAEIFAEGRPPITVDLQPTSSSFLKPLIIDQPHTEMVLEQALEHLGQRVIRGVQLLEFSVADDGVSAKLKDINGEIDCQKFSYIVGADGAHSMVRKSMSNQFLGTTYDDAFILADVQCIHAFDHNHFRIFFKKKQFFAMIPMQGEHHYRLISVRRGERKKEGPSPTLEEFTSLAKKVVPFPVEIKNPQWISRFFVQCRSANSYQEGRIFLVGDAAHIHSPAGGQGMNTGLQDAYNLAWKLAMVIKGQAPETLLDTYQQERKPVGDFLIDRTDRLFKFMVKSSLLACILRRFMLPWFAKKPLVIRKFGEILSQTAIRYDEGARCEHNEHPLVNGICVGERMPNFNVISSHLKKTDIHSLLINLRISVLFFMPKGVNKKPIKQAQNAAHRLYEKFGSLVCSHLIFASDYDAEKLFHDGDYLVLSDEAFLTGEPYFVAIRPDAHVFCLGGLAEINELISTMRQFFKSHGEH